MGSPQFLQRAQSLQDQRWAQQNAPKDQAVKAHGMAIAGLQQKLSTIDQAKDPKAYADIVDQIQQNVHGMRELLHPDAKLGAGDWLKTHTTDRLHITNHDQRVKDLAAKNAQGVTQDASTAQAYGQGAVEAPNPYQQEKTQLGEVGFSDDQIQKALETKAGLNPKLAQDGSPYKGTDGKWYQNFRDPTGQISSREMPPNYTGPTATTADAKEREDFANDPNKKPGETYEQWKGRQSKTPNRDDRYIAIETKRQEGQDLTPEEKAYSAAYDIWTKKTKVDPGVARAAAFGADRFVPIIDPNDSEKVSFMRVGDAAKQDVGSPASIAFQTDKALTRAFTSGQPAQTINYFNTATEHLKQLQQAADALQNGDIQLFNKAANAWAAGTGNPAPTNFATIRNAVAGELSKTFKGAAATDAEIDAINTSINSAQSPAQLSGAIGNNIKLMGSKMDALKGQYEQGKQGKPNFPGTGTTHLQGMRPPQGATGTVKYQGKTYWVGKDGTNLGEKTQ